MMMADAAVAQARAGSAEILIDRRLDEQRARIALAGSEDTGYHARSHAGAARTRFNTGWRAAVGFSIPVHDASGRRARREATSRS
jgi:hypothetical protein